jgi:hypothetical protein
MIRLRGEYANAGDPTDEHQVFEVTQQCRQLVLSTALKDRIILKASMDLKKLFGFDPAVDKNKQLRIRYRMKGVYATMILDVLPNNHLPSRMFLIAPDKRCVADVVHVCMVYM